MNLDRLLNVIKELCNQKGVTQKEALIKSGAGDRFFQNVRQGSTPSVEKLEALSAYFGVSIDYLVGNTDYPYIVTAAEMEELKNPNIISKNIAAFGGAETLTVDSKALDAAIEKALKAKGLISHYPLHRKFGLTARIRTVKPFYLICKYQPFDA